MVRAQISSHFEHRVQQTRAQLQSKLVELERAVKAAETARDRWDTTGEITSSAATGDPRTAAAVEKEVFPLTLYVDWPCHQACEAARDNPDDQHARDQFLLQQARVTAVQFWLDRHGYSGHAPAGDDLDWDEQHRAEHISPAPGGSPAR